MPSMMCKTAIGTILKCNAKDDEALAIEYENLIEKHIHSGAHADLFASPREHLADNDATIYFLIDDEKDEIISALHVIAIEDVTKISGLVKEAGYSYQAPRLLVSCACIDQTNLSGKAEIDIVADIRLYALSSDDRTVAKSQFNEKSFAVFKDVAFRFKNIKPTRLSGNSIDSSLLTTSEACGIIRAIQMTASSETLSTAKQWIADMTFSMPLKGGELEKTVYV